MHTANSQELKHRQQINQVIKLQPSDQNLLSTRVQLYSQVNKMSAHNLAVVLVPTLFQTVNQDLLRLSRELIIHHTLLFLVNGLCSCQCFGL